MGKGGESIVFLFMSVARQVISGGFFSHPWFIYFWAACMTHAQSSGCAFSHD